MKLSRLNFFQRMMGAHLKALGEWRPRKLSLPKGGTVSANHLFETGAARTGPFRSPQEMERQKEKVRQAVRKRPLLLDGGDNF